MATEKQLRRINSIADFWKEKTPLWGLAHCPSWVQADSPAPRQRECACWEIEDTYGKWTDLGSLGRDTSSCLICEVYRRYGKGQDIELK